MRKSVAACLATVAASFASFLVHRAFADFLPKWIGEHMEGVEIKRPPYGPEVVIPASLSAVEYGLALFAAYFLIRRAIPNSTVLVRSLCLFILCLALGGQLLRFPLMQLVVGNPLLVTVVQHAGIWLPYLAGSLAVAFVYEYAVTHGD